VSGVLSPAAVTQKPALLEVNEDQQVILLAEIEVLLAAVRDPVARAPFADLASEVLTGKVGEAGRETLEKILEMSLQTGRARRVHGPEAEQSLLRLFHQTPGGAAARRATDAVNEALRRLAGQTLEDVLFTVQGPGALRLGLKTDRCRLTLEIDRHGVTVESLEV
jgi:hypothetical protein